MAVISSSAFCCWLFSFMGWVGTNCSPVLGSRCTASSFRGDEAFGFQAAGNVQGSGAECRQGADCCFADEK